MQKCPHPQDFSDFSVTWTQVWLKYITLIWRSKSRLVNAKVPPLPRPLWLSCNYDPGVTKVCVTAIWRSKPALANAKVPPPLRLLWLLCDLDPGVTKVFHWNLKIQIQTRVGQCKSANISSCTINTGLAATAAEFSWDFIQATVTHTTLDSRATVRAILCSSSSLTECDIKL